MFQILAIRMARDKDSPTLVGRVTRTKTGVKIKKPRSDYLQNCVLISVATANSRKKKEQRESGAERKRKSRAKKKLQMDAKLKDKKIVKKSKEKSNMNILCDNLFPVICFQITSIVKFVLFI